MSLMDFEGNGTISIRNQNFQLCRERNLSIEETDSHINLYNDNFDLIKTFFGHIKLNEYLNE